MSTNTRRPQRRNLDTQAPTIPTELKQLAREFYLENKAANEAKRKAETARKKLFKAMTDQGHKSFDFQTTQGDSRVTLQAEIKAGRATTVIDTKKLRELVDNDDAFMECVSATKTTVDKLFGSAMTDRVGEVKAGKEAVYVAPKK